MLSKYKNEGNKERKQTNRSFKNQMKQFFTRSVCFLMALQVLISSTGFATTEHWCAVRGKKTFLFTKPKPCCNVSEKQAHQTSKPTLKRGKCCKDQTVFHKLNANASTLKVSQFDFQAPAAEFFLAKSPVFIANVVVLSPRLLAHYFNPAPPATGRQILTRIQCFLI